MQDIVLYFVAIISIINLLLLFFSKAKNDTEGQIDKVKKEMLDELRATRQEILQATQNNVKGLSDVLVDMQKQGADAQDKSIQQLGSSLTSKQDTLQKTLSDMLQKLDSRFAEFMTQNEQKLENIRATLQNRIASMQEDNNKRLEEMRATVDEKLQKTLEERIGQSFKLVSERLEQVYKGLGEMQTLASGVGDLKKVLSNVKTRGVLGEIQLGAILEQMLSPEQYDKNVATKAGSGAVVEFAIKLPGDDGGAVYLPIDAKFPADAYSQLVDAYDTGNQAEVDVAATALDRRIKQFAKDIHDKYVDPPNTTDFAILFLPFEGLYAEVVRRGMVEILQNDYKISIAGPTTMAALLNSLQMGFKTLAIQKRSSEVWNVLGAVKTEFNKFENVLQATQKRIEQANDELDKLVGTRTRQIQRRLKAVSALPESESNEMLEEADEPDL